MSTPRLGLVVVNYGSHALLQANLAALDLAAVPAEVVVVDNHHSTAERDAITTLAAQQGWTLLTNTGNPGFGTAVNLGAMVAFERGCTSVLLLNPDVEIEIATMRALLDDATRRPNTMISPRILRRDGSSWFRGGGIRVGTGDVTANAGPELDGPGAWLTAACLAVPRGLWTRIGGFDNDYFMYWEDVDLSWRCARRGGQLAVRDDLVVVHDVGSTQAGSLGAKSTLYYYYNCRNRLLFAAKNLSVRDRLRWMLATPRSSWLILLRGGRSQLIRSPRPLWSAVHGSLSGLAAVLGARTGRIDAGRSATGGGTT